MNDLDRKLADLDTQVRAVGSDLLRLRTERKVLQERLTRGRGDEQLLQERLNDLNAEVAKLGLEVHDARTKPE